MSIVSIPKDAPFFLGLLLFNSLVLLGCHIFRGRLTLGPLFASSGAMTLLFWQMRHLGWWLQWSGLIIDTASYAFIPSLLMGLIFCYAFDGTRAARAYWSILIFTSILSWSFAEFRDSLAYFVPIPYVLYLPTQAHVATLLGLFMAAAMALVSYAIFCQFLRAIAFTLALLIAVITFVIIDSLVEYGLDLGWKHSLDISPGFLLFTLPAAVFSQIYSLYGRSIGLYMPIRSVQDILFFWRSTDSHPLSPNQDFLETGRVISDLRHLNNQLQETQRIHDYQVLHNPLAIITTDTLGNIQSANPAALTLFDWSSESLLQNSILPYLHGISFPQLCLESSLQTLPFLTAQNEERWHEYVATPIYNDYHKPIGYQLIVKDVTDFKRREFKKDIEDKVQNIHRTGKMFSHDISNLFLGIQGALGQIKVLSSQPEDVLFTAACEQISAALSQGRMMLSQLSKSQTLGSPQLAICDLAEAIQEAINITVTRAHENQVTIHFQVHKNPLISADKTQISRVLTNLLSNAISASSAGDSIWVTLTEVGNGANIVVIDEGKGMTQAQLMNAFDPGFSSKGAGQGGLGLAISYLIVEAHGGLLRLTSNDNGKGIAADIWLPGLAVNHTWHGKQLLLALPKDSQLVDLFGSRIDQLGCEWVESQGEDELQEMLLDSWDLLLIHECLLSILRIETVSIPVIIVIHTDLSLETLKGEDISALFTITH